jgi:sortase A
MKIRIRSHAARRLLRLLDSTHRALLLAGGCLLAWPLFVTAQSSYTQWAGERQLVRNAFQETIVVPRPGAPSAAPRFSRGALLGRFEIPRLQLSYVVLEGTDNRTLDRSIGHIEGTGHIGEDGNIGIAGHRNTHFRKLEWIRRGDELVLTGRSGHARRYRVEWTRLFQPDDSQVLDPSQGPAVTLVTCYPFEYVGAAPLRFIVRALPAE